MNLQNIFFCFNYKPDEEKEAERESLVPLLEYERSEEVGRGSRTGVGWIKAAMSSILLLN